MHPLHTALRRILEAWVKVQDGDFIPLVHNYCDRWCEKCPLTARCRLYAMQKEMDAGDPEATDIQRFEKTLQAALELMKSVMEREGIAAPTAEEMAEYKKAEEARRKPVLESALFEMGMDYLEASDRWFKDSLPTPREMGYHSEEDGLAIAEAIDVVNWYRTLIPAKVARAVEGLSDDDGDFEPGERDADGSAKVALIGLDRSLAMWAFLREKLKDPGDRILDLLAQLSRFRRAVEAQFPEARRFNRPGLDD